MYIRPFGFVMKSLSGRYVLYHSRTRVRALVSSWDYIKERKKARRFNCFITSLDRLNLTTATSRVLNLGGRKDKSYWLLLRIFSKLSN